MADITAASVKELREMTGAGMMDCKNALKESDGDLTKAVEVLRKKGLKSVAKRSGKVAAEGIVFSYIHPGSQIGVMLELNCETDFVARGDDFQDLAKALAMQVAALKPAYVSREGVPAEVIESEQAVYRGQLKPGQEKVADKIISGKLEKFFEEQCLVDQVDVRDSGGKKKISQLIDEVSAKVGEKISISRFTRFEVGEGVEREEVNYAEEVAAAAAV